MKSPPNFREIRTHWSFFENPEANPAINRNADPEWNLANRDTVKIGLNSQDLPKRIELGGLFSIKPHSHPLEFSVGLAVHRGQGDLEVALQAESTKSSHKVPFDSAFHGGRSPDGYQWATIPLPASSRKLTLSLAIEAESATSEGAEQGTFFFVTSPKIAPPDTGGQQQSSLLMRGSVLSGAGTWFRAQPAARISANSEVQLITKEGSTQIMDTSPQEIKLVEDHGHTIVLSAEQPANFALHIDGAFAFSHHIGSKPTSIRIPPRFLNGAIRRLSVWDQAGLQQHFSTYVLFPRSLTPADVMQREGSLPYLQSLGCAPAHRMKGLRALLNGDTPDTVRTQAEYCLSVLEDGHDTLRLKPIAFPEVKKPDISVIIPAHNEINVTYLALCSLLFAPNKASFEVILVDDASSDETAEIEKIVRGIRVVRNETPQRFIRSCNAGAQQAQGRHVALLNNDVEVTAGWLDALVDAFERFENVGLVGSKLLYPDGRLQDGGGLIWKSGNPWNYGHGDNPADPRFCYARQVDYLSGAAMMTTKEIWDKVGGLSAYLEPMYFEDTDFAFKVREAGYATWYVPSSVVFHFEGMTSGTDTSSGFKKYQEVNRPKFKRRWSEAFRAFGEEAVRPDLEKDRGITGRVLFIDHGTPRPDRDAGSYAAIQEIKMVQALGYKVTFLPENLAHLGGYTDELERMGVEVIYAPFVLSVNEFLEKHAKDFDAFFITRYYVAQSVLPKLRELAPGRKILFNNADLHFLRELRTAISEDNPAGIEAAKETRRQEIEVMGKVDLVLSYNEVEHSVISSHTDGAVNVVKCPWVVDLPSEVRDLKDRKGLSFLGNFKHYPNVEAVEWFARSVMPRLSGNPQAELSIYGAGMTHDVRALKGGCIDPVGFIEDVADAYDRHRIFIAPLQSGAGIKGKVLSALSHGIPCILSPVAAEGIGLRHGFDCMIAKRPEDWVTAIRNLLENDALWLRLSENSRAFVREEYSFTKGQTLMKDAFEAVGLF